MAPIVSAIEVDRPPEAAYAFVTDPSRFPEWQPAVTAGSMDRDPVATGAVCTTSRRIGGTVREIHSQITEYDPPRRWADHGTDGPIRGIVTVDVAPLDGGRRSRIVIGV